MRKFELSAIGNYAGEVLHTLVVGMLHTLLRTLLGTLKYVAFVNKSFGLFQLHFH